MPFNILEEVSNVNLDELAEPLDITDGFGDIDLISTDNIYSSNPFYKFPQDIISEKQHVNFMILAPYAETMDPLTISNPIPDIVVTELAPIFLLLPSNFQESYSHNYIPENILINRSNIEGIKNLASGEGIAGAKAAIGKSLGDFASTGAISIPDLGLGDTTGLTHAGISNLVPSGIYNSIRSLTHGGSRAAIELLYDSPNLRQWTMEFKFLPKNASEEAELMDIIKYLKWLSAPYFKMGWQEYPAVFDLEFMIADPKINNITYSFNDEITHAKEKKLNNKLSGLSDTLILKKMALTSINFNAGDKLMLSPSGFPLASTLSLTFQEIRYLDRKDIKNSDNFSNLEKNNKAVIDTLNKIGESL